MDGVNNFSKNRISYRDDVLTKSFQAKNNDDVENVDNRVQDLHNEDLHGEMIYIYEDGVEGFVGEFGSNSMNEEGSEKNIEEGNEYIGGKETFEQNKEDYNQGNAHGNDDTVHGHGVRRTNSNIVGRHWFKW
jgi:hypothetical protein